MYPNSNPYPVMTGWQDAIHYQNSSDRQDAFVDKQHVLRAVVAFICALSMIGALLIILSYVCVKSIRTKTRQILVHLSVADFGVACANFVGATVYFDQYIRECNYNSSVPIPCRAVENLCTTQAFFAAYCTLASVLWTLSLAVYVHCLVVYSGSTIHIKMMRFSMLFCWGMPLLVAVWLVATDRLGYAPVAGSGWCSLKLSGHDNIFLVIFANDLWIYLTFFMVTLLYLTTHCHIKLQLRKANPILLSVRGNVSALHSADTKFLLIPGAFLLLRIWSVILMFLVIYLQVIPPLTVSYILLYATGIGDSGQGFVNALLFCVFTPKVRKKLLCACCCCCARDGRCCQRRTDYVALSSSTSPTESHPCLSTSPNSGRRPISS